MNNSQSLTEIFGDVISSYTRKQAIEDGILYDITGPDSTIFRYPVAVTSEIYELLAGPNISAWTKDLCFMAAKGTTKKINDSTFLFTVILPAKPLSGQKKAVELKVNCGPGDNWEPVITIMYPNQD